MKRAKYNLSHYKLLSMDMGRLVPIGLLEVLPGDTFKHSTNMMVRCNPMVAPPMHPVNVQVHHVYVPHRLIWEDFEDFITGGPDGDSAPVFPTISTGGSGFAVGSLADYLGVPPLVASRDVSALPFRAVALAWNVLFRDQDLQDELVIDKTSGPDTTTNTTLQYVNWGKDYPTTARPFEQKGPSVSIPVSGDASVITNNQPIKFKTTPDGTDRTMSGAVSTNAAIFAGSSFPGTQTNMRFGTESGLQVDLASDASIDVNDLRLGLALQTFEEARALYGSEYKDYLNYLGVRSSDGRLQRPEYLGGSSQTIQFSEVLGTVNNDDTDVGQLAGHGITAMKTNAYTRFFEEHGYVISFAVVRPKNIYANGLPRTWNRRNKYDFWQKETQHIGQQEVLNKEIYLAGASPDGVFGWGDRYREYREEMSTIAGEFRTTLNFWHFARIFASAPALNSAFVSMADVPERPFADQTSNTLLVMAKHRVGARRLVSKSSKPGVR